MQDSGIQQGILDPIPAHAGFLIFDLEPGADPKPALQRLATLADGKSVVLGLGAALLTACGKHLPGLREFPQIAGAKVNIPANQAALWIWLRAEERGALAHCAQQVLQAVQGAFGLQRSVDSFRFDSGRDLTGYEDGTENPRDQDALDAAIVSGRGAGLDGSSFVAVQQWLHHWDKFGAMPQPVRDDAIGRRLSDNEELAEAPESAHVKRTAQESFEPEAFVLRRSMPWSRGAESGFYFVAFGKTLDAFEVQLRRMSGAEDGIVDGLFSFTEPLDGYYFWCPPVRDHHIDLTWLLA